MLSKQTRIQLTIIALQSDLIKSYKNLENQAHNLMNSNQLLMMLILLMQKHQQLSSQFSTHNILIHKLKLLKHNSYNQKLQQSQEFRQICQKYHSKTFYDHSDRDSVIKNIKKPQNSNTQIGNKNSKKNMNKIDAIFVLAICWQYGNRIQNIQLVQLMLDTYAFQLLIAQKINSSALVINNWKKYIQNLNKNKTTLNRIYSVLKSLQVPIHQQQPMPSHIYIPL